MYHYALYTKHIALTYHYAQFLNLDRIVYIYLCEKFFDIFEFIFV